MIVFRSIFFAYGVSMIEMLYYAIKTT